MWVTYLCVFVGAAIGGVGRYGLSGVVANWIGAGFPWGTLVVNVTGCFVIGVFNTLTGPDGVFLVPGNLRVVRILRYGPDRKTVVEHRRGGGS